MSAGKLFGVGVGPGDPELMTLKAMRALGEADVIAHFAKAGNASHSRAIVARAFARTASSSCRCYYPVTTELPTCSSAAIATPSALFTTRPPPRSPRISKPGAPSP